MWDGAETPDHATIVREILRRNVKDFDMIRFWTERKSGVPQGTPLSIGKPGIYAARRTSVRMLYSATASPA